MLCTVYRLLYTLSCMLGTVYYVLCTAYCILYAVYRILYTVCCISYTAYYILWTVYCTLYTVYCILHTVYCMLCIVCCVLYTVHYMMYCATSSRQPPRSASSRQPAQPGGWAKSNPDLGGDYHQGMTRLGGWGVVIHLALTLELVYGADFWCNRHCKTNPVDLEGSRGQVWPNNGRKWTPLLPDSRLHPEVR
jgi:hypothetical protein